MKRIGILTSGGDCQGLNAVIRGVAKSLYEKFNNDVEIYGIKNGYKGLISGEYERMKRENFSGILTLGGTILGTSREPFKQIQIVDENAIDKVFNMKENYKKIGLDCLIILGGNGTQKTANLLSNEGLNIIHIPKTIDNDVYGTDMTFGFYSSLDVATEVIDRLHTTATSHGRIFIVEIMGHKVGHLALNAGIAGGADVILIPEIPYDIQKIATVINKRNLIGKNFSIIVCAEGALSKKESMLSKSELKKMRSEYNLPSIVYRIADELKTLVKNEIRVCVPGHFQRGGSPNAYDRILSTRMGAKAAELIEQKKYGCMVALKNGKIETVPLKDCAGKLKMVNVNCEEIQAAKEIGISFGN